MTDHKADTFRIFSALDIIFRNGSFLLKEIFSSEPGSTNLKAYISSCLKDNTVDKKPYKIEEGDRYKPIDHQKSLRWRFKKAANFGALTFSDLKRHPDIEDVLGPAKQARKGCKIRIQRYLATKGIVLSRHDLKKILKPMMFSHDVEKLKVEIQSDHSIEPFKALIRKHRKQFKTNELKSLFETEACSVPAFRPSA